MAPYSGLFCTHLQLARHAIACLAFAPLPARLYASCHCGCCGLCRCVRCQDHSQRSGRGDARHHQPQKRLKKKRPGGLFDFVSAKNAGFLRYRASRWSGQSAAPGSGC